MTVLGRAARRVQVLQVPDCPLVGRLLELLEECGAAADVDLDVEVIVGEYPSPTLVVDGVDVTTDQPVSQITCCRLDLPTRAQVLAALRQPDAR